MRILLHSQCKFAYRLHVGGPCMLSRMMNLLRKAR